MHQEEVKKVTEQKIEKKEKIYKSQISILKELYQNEDIIVELSIPSLDFNEIIVKGKDNIYYLTHDIQKKEKKQGTAFMDYRTLEIDTAKQINIYGHNSIDRDLPFAILENYQKEDFFKEHRNIILKTEKNYYSYKIFAVSRVPKNYEEHMIIAYEGEEFLNHVNKMRSNALLDTKENITKNDDILVLQTCLFDPKEFLLVFAKKIQT